MGNWLEDRFEIGAHGGHTVREGCSSPKFRATNCSVASEAVNSDTRGGLN